MISRKQFNFYKEQSAKYDNMTVCGFPHDDQQPRRFSDPADCERHIKAVHYELITLEQIATSLKEIRGKLYARPKGKTIPKTSR